jgi:2'-5' RNA ligase
VAGFGKGDTLVLRPAAAEVARAFDGLWLALGIALANAGLSIKDRKPTPHMTLAYKCRAVLETPIAPIVWTARDLVLIDSHVGKHRHDVLGHWTLGV